MESLLIPIRWVLTFEYCCSLESNFRVAHYTPTTRFELRPRLRSVRVGAGLSSQTERDTSNQSPDRMLGDPGLPYVYLPQHDARPLHLRAVGRVLDGISGGRADGPCQHAGHPPRGDRRLAPYPCLRESAPSLGDLILFSLVLLGGDFSFGPVQSDAPGLSWRP